MKYTVIVKWKGNKDETVRNDMSWNDVLQYMVDIHNSAMQESIDNIVTMPTERFERLGALMDSVDPDVSAR